MSEDMSPYCSAHDEWLIMKLCMYANKVSNFGGDPIIWAVEISFVLRARRTISRDAATGLAAVATRSRAGCWSMEDRRRKSLMYYKIASNGHTSLSTALV